MEYPNLKPFQPGMDPRRNLKGRPKGSKNNDLEKVINKILDEKVGHGKDRATYRAILAREIVKRAIKGSDRLVKLLFKYLE